MKCKKGEALLKHVGGSVIKNYRLRHGMTQGDLSDFLLVDQATVSLWESDQVGPNGPALILLHGLISLDQPPRNVRLTVVNDGV